MEEDLIEKCKKSRLPEGEEYIFGEEALLQEDIKVLEDYAYAMCTISSTTEQDQRIANAIENLIKGYRELEEKVNKYEKQIDLEWVEENYIEESKVRKLLDTKYIAMFEGDK